MAALKAGIQIEEQVKKCSSLTPIHGDSHAENLLLDKNKEVKWIDWECSGMGDPYFDLANFSRSTFLSADQTKEFLNYYLNRTPTGSEEAHLELMRLTNFIRVGAFCFYKSTFKNSDPVFAECGQRFLGRFDDAVQKPHFNRWMEEVCNSRL